MNATIRSINRAMVVIAAPVGGVLADRLGYRAMLWWSAAGFLAVAVALAASRYRDARIPSSPVEQPAGLTG